MTQSPDPKKIRNTTHSWVAYSGMVFQLMVLLLLGWWIGQWIDTKMHNEEPYVAIALVVLFLIGYFYKLYHDLMK